MLVWVVVVDGVTAFVSVGDLGFWWENEVFGVGYPAGPSSTVPPALWDGV